MISELSFKACYINGNNIAGVSSLADGRAVLHFNGGKGLGLVSDSALRAELLASKLGHSYCDQCLIPTADAAGIRALVPGAVVDWEGSPEYLARRAAARGSRPGRSGSSSSSSSASSSSSSSASAVPSSDTAGAAPTAGAVGSEDVPPVDLAGVISDACATACGAMGGMIAGAITPAVNDAAARLVADALAAAPSAQVLTIETTRGKFEADNKEYFHPLFAEICAEIEDNNGVYLYGPAGTGKSYMAAQVARALSLDFYTDNKLLMDYDAKGFADAAGKLVETQFFQAFTKGGLYFLDEINASSALALKVLNDALANGVFTFPVVGTVKCHENFRFMAAGNGVGVGSGFVDKYGVRYIGCNPLDDSTRDRFQTWIEVDYCDEISMAVAVPYLGAAAGEAVEFLNALRMAQKRCGLGLLVSNRPLKALCKRVARGMDMATALGLTWSMLGADKLNQLAGALECSNKWGAAFRQLAKNESKKAI